MDDDVKFVKLSDKACTPVRATCLAAGYDLASTSTGVIAPGGRLLISTGIALSLPSNTYARIAGRSGLALKHGICVGAGVIDADFRGEVKCLLFNHGDQPFYISSGKKIAQLIVTPVCHPVFIETTVDNMEMTDRGSRGFGSTDDYLKK